MEPSLSVTQAQRGDLGTLVRHQLGSLVSGFVDFATMIALVRMLALSPALATAGGAATGAVTNFLLGQRLVFTGASGSTAGQAARYALVSGTSLLLNTFGEYVLTGGGMRVQYVVARAFVALAVSLLWNFPMQRYFVFRHETAS